MLSQNEESSVKNEINCPLNFCKGNKATKVWKLLRPLNIIVSMLMFGMLISLRRRFRDNLIYRQICIDRLKRDYSCCYRIDPSHNVSDVNDTVLEILHLTATHKFTMVGMRIILELLSACILCSWSDSYGRKFPLLIALLGESIEVFSFFTNDIPYMYFIYALYTLTILSGLLGGDICIFAMIYCILTDHSSLKSRPLSFAMIDLSYMAGLICGVVIFRNAITDNVILVSFWCLLTLRYSLIIWVWFTVAEKHLNLNDGEISKKLKLLLSSAHIMDTYKAIKKRRLNCQSEQLCLLMASAVPVLISYTCK